MKSTFLLVLVFLISCAMALGQCPMPSGLPSGTRDRCFAPFDTGKASNNNFVVTSIVLQPSGKSVIGGYFERINGVTVNGICRLNVDGTLDTSFHSGTGVDQSVATIVRQSDGKLLVGGDFSRYNGTQQFGICRLNPEGDVDASFNISRFFSPGVYSIAIQGNKMLLAGPAGFSGAAIKKISINGQFDPRFRECNLGGEIHDMAVLADSSILVAGFFDYNNRYGQSSNIVHVKSNGTIDMDYVINANHSVQSVALQADGKAIIGGLFTTVSDVNQAGICRINRDGTVDSTFRIGSGFDGWVYKVALQADGKILVGGNFSHYQGYPAQRLCRLNPDGSIDLTYDFSIGFNKEVYTMLQQPNGRWLIGGYFTSLRDSAARMVCRLKSDGRKDRSFMSGTQRAGFDGVVKCMKVLRDGKILVAGEFTSFDNVDRRGICRLNPDGSLDPLFDPGLGADDTLSSFQRGIKCMQVLSDGKILIGGDFNIYNGVRRRYLCRLHPDGRLDSIIFKFPVANSPVSAFLIQPDGKIIVTTDWGPFRMNPDASIDRTFLHGARGSGPIITMLAQPDGRILYGRNPYNDKSLERVHSDGSLDSSFWSGRDFDDRILALAHQPDGKIIVGGTFRTWNRKPCVLLARINSDGTLDSTFHANGGAGFDADSLYVNCASALYLQADGKIIVGGLFKSYDGMPCANLCRLNSDGSLDPSFQVGSGLTGGFRPDYFQVPVADILKLDANRLVLAGNFYAYRNENAGNIMAVYTTTTPTEVEEKLNSNQVRPFAFPNPTRHSFTVSGVAQSGILRLYDVLGRLILQTWVQPGQPVSVEGIKSGVYRWQLGRYGGNVSIE